MTEQQYRVIADRDKGDDPQNWDRVEDGDRVTVRHENGEFWPVRIERPVATMDDQPRCPDCRHQPHDGAACLNMASEHDCVCVYGFQQAASSVPTTDEEQDERIEAWYYVADHPLFKQCYGKEQSLIDSMLERLNDLADMESTIAESTPSVPTREQIAAQLEDLHARWHDQPGNMFGRDGCGWIGCYFYDAAEFALIQKGTDR